MDRINYFTSESVSEGHPDKICDQISDAVLDECLKYDPESRVACETYCTTGMVLVGGEINTQTYVDIRDIAKKVVKNIGYTDPRYGFYYDDMAVLNMIQEQSPDISQGVTEGEGLFKEQGAGDQGIMFGFACNDTEELMPAPIMYSHKILKMAALLRKDNTLSYLRPDAKAQICVQYRGHKIERIKNIVLSTQHDDDIEHKQIENDIIEKVIKSTLEYTNLLDAETEYFINPTGKFVLGGPKADTGLTGRKIIVDTYGGMGKHGGGAFSGKDPSKVDRSACYMARYIAKNIVKTGICPKIELQLSYAIGIARPLSVRVDSFNQLDSKTEEKLEEIINKIFDLTPQGIINTLDLKKAIYKKTATYGHFGNSEFNWEKTDKVEEIKRLL